MGDCNTRTERMVAESPSVIILFHVTAAKDCQYANSSLVRDFDLYEVSVSIRVHKQFTDVLQLGTKGSRELKYQEINYIF